MDICLGILSWKAHLTLKNTLESYSNLFPLVSEKKIFFQEISENDRQIAQKYNLDIYGNAKNVGITGGFKELVLNTKSKYFIFAENDFQLTQSIEKTKQILQDSLSLLEDYDVQIVKLRDRINYGEPLYTKTTEKLNMDFPYKLESLHFITEPELTFPNTFEIINLNYKWYKCGYEHQKWSNNIFIAKTNWLKESVLPLLDNADFMMENTLIDTLKNYNLANGDGLFTHNRLDR